MVVSTTVLYLTFCKQKNSSTFQFHETPNSENKPILRSCLYTEEKKREKRRNKKKVKFSENVMVKEFREKPGKKNRVSINECRNEIPETKAMPANRVALYNGILRDRVQRMGCCH
nr:unknown [Medicago truncatula]